MKLKTVLILGVFISALPFTIDRTQPLLHFNKAVADDKNRNEGGDRKEGRDRNESDNRNGNWNTQNRNEGNKRGCSNGWNCRNSNQEQGGDGGQNRKGRDSGGED